MNNESGLKPLGRAVLIEPYVPERKTSIIVMPDEVNERQQMLEQRAIVVEVGANAWNDEPTPRAQVGDKVFVAKFAGFTATGPKDGKQYRFVNDRDIFAAITGE